LGNAQIQQPKNLQLDAAQKFLGYSSTQEQNREYVTTYRAYKVTLLQETRRVEIQLLGTFQACCSSELPEQHEKNPFQNTSTNGRRVINTGVGGAEHSS
jgi:hypothetical protein